MSKEQSNRKALVTIVRISKIGSWAFLLSIIGASLAGFTNFAFSFLLGKVSQSAITQATLGIFDGAHLLNLFIIFLCVCPLMFLGQMLNVTGGQLAEKRLKKKMVHHILRQKEAAVKASHSGDMMTLITSDAGVVDNFYFQGITYMFIHPLVGGISALIATWIIDYRFALVAFVIGCITVFVSTRYSNRIQDSYKMSRKYQNNSTNQVSEILSNEPMIRQFAIEKDMLELYEEHNTLYADEVIKAEGLKHKVNRWNETFSTLSMVIFLAIGIYLTINSDFDFALIMLLLPLKSSISYMFNSLSQSWNFILEVSTSAERILDMLDEPLEDLRQELPDLTKTKSDIIFENIGFGYDESNKVLDGFNLMIDDKSTLALLGESGSGKSTLFQLLLGFYEAQEGSIRIGGNDLRQFSLSSVRDHMVYVQQESPLFNLSIRENMTLGSSHSEETIIEAAQKAAIHDFIVSLPDGYDTMVGEGASKISGGQRQRIAIARALLSNAPILIMDEPTSALDSESERLIQKSLNAIRKEKTVLIAAHRLSTIRDADKIVVLDKGHLVEQGSHFELIELKGIYHRYVKGINHENI